MLLHNIKMYLFILSGHDKYVLGLLSLITGYRSQAQKIWMNWNWWVAHGWAGQTNTAAWILYVSNLLILTQTIFSSLFFHNLWACNKWKIYVYREHLFGRFRMYLLRGKLGTLDQYIWWSAIQCTLGNKHSVVISIPRAILNWIWLIHLQTSQHSFQFQAFCKLQVVVVDGVQLP